MSDPRTPLKTRRELLGLLGGVGAAIVVAGCAGDGSKGVAAGSRSTTTTTAATSSSSTTAAVAATCSKIPQETAGPFPGDGTNGPNILTEDGVVRSDIRSSIGSASGVATGVPLTIDLTIVDTGNGCTALPGAAVYIWHCNVDGEYSMYGSAIADENYLRGVQVADANGQVSFTSIFPAAYSGRWPHVHFEVFSSLAEATNGRNAITTSQLALPADVCNAVFATDGYEQSARNMAQSSLESDMVFSDGHSLQAPTMTGNPTSGYTAQLQVGV
jgi:protocatechuate 3,4-dioxygenase beta subunit